VKPQAITAPVLFESLKLSSQEARGDVEGNAEQCRKIESEIMNSNLEARQVFIATAANDTDYAMPRRSNRNRKPVELVVKIFEEARRRPISDKDEDSEDDN